MEVASELISKESIEKLLVYLPYFLQNNRFEKEDKSEKVKGLMEYPEYTDEIEAFIKTVYAAKFLVQFKWQIWDEGRQMASDFDQIAKADLLTLRMLMTALLRSERFIPGSFLEALEYGVITQILVRLKELNAKEELEPQEDKAWIQKLFEWADEKRIPDYPTELTKEEKLRVLTGTPLDGFPRDEETLLSLKTLSIGWNDLGELPKEIGKLKNLVEIRAWCANLTKLPREIGDLENLVRLSLAENELTKLPKEIGKLSKLEVLELDSNPIKELPKEIGNLSNLRELRFSEIHINTLPKEIGKLKKLKELRIEESKNFKNLPVEIGELSGLETLYIWSCDLSVLPKEIGKLKNLSYLDLSQNNLTEIPSEVCNMSNLVYLNTGCNKILKIPKEIVKLTNLSSFEIYNNNLKEIPIEVNQLTFEHFCFYDNPLIEVPMWLKVKAKTLCPRGKQFE